MNRFVHTAFPLLMAAAMLFSSTACKKDKAKFKTQTLQATQASFDIPADWEKLPSETEEEHTLVFAQAGERPVNGFNNVSVRWEFTDKRAPRLEDVEAVFGESFEEQTKERLPDAFNFVYQSYEGKNGTVFTAAYQCTMMGREMKITVFYPLIDSVSLYLTSCQSTEEKILPDDVAKYVIDTFTKTAQEVPESQS